AATSSVTLPSFTSLTPPPPTSTLFPYTTLFRSRVDRSGARVEERADERRGVVRRARVVGLERTVRRLARRHHRLRAEDVDRELRSEEHTSELQSRGHLVCRLLLEKKKQKRIQTT